MKKYWMVHNPDNNKVPTNQHNTKHLADTEAKRLAKLHIGQSFVVLEAVDGFKIDIPEPNQISFDINYPIIQKDSIF